MTTEQMIKASQFLTKTPGGGDAYYNVEQDAAIIIYPTTTRIYTERREGIEGKTASCFKLCQTVATRTC